MATNRLEWVEKLRYIEIIVIMLGYISPLLELYLFIAFVSFFLNCPFHYQSCFESNCFY